MSSKTALDSGSNGGQVAYWNDRAAITWTALQERIDTVFAPLTALALDAAAPVPGERVIDVGCGCGATLLELAHRVGPEGEVVGLDVSEPMSARARERIAAEALSNVQVIVSDAATYAFEGDRADLLFSRFGVMFFANPGAALGNLRRAIRPGGRLLFVAWRQLAENSWFTVPLEAARPLLPLQAPPEPDGPGPFGFADAGRVEGFLSAAGWRDVSMQRRAVPMRLAAAGQIEEATEFATRIGPLAGILAEADSDLRSHVRQAVANTLRAHDGPDGITLTGSVWLISARA